MKNYVDGVLWDLDGTLIDVSNSYLQAISRTVNDYLGQNISIDLIKEIKQDSRLNNDWDATFVIVQNLMGVVDYQFEKLSMDRKGKLYQELKEIFQKIYLGSSNKPSEGGLISTSENLLIDFNLFEFLKQKYITFGLVTGRPRLEAEFSLNKFDLAKFFEVTVCMEDTELHKPEPEPILKAMDLLDLKTPVYIGDSLADVISAKSAGIKSIYVGDEDYGDFRVSNINKIINIL